MINLSVKKIINNLFQAQAHYEGFSGTAIALNEAEALKKSLEWLKREIDEYRQAIVGFDFVDQNCLKIFKIKIQELAGLADHYYLSESEGLENSIGWGPQGLELRGIVKITHEQRQRIQHFSNVASYNIALNNCEHFANFVLYGINLSSQQYIWWKSLGAGIIQSLQTKNSVSRNLEEEISSVFKQNLMAVKLSKFDQEYQEKIENLNL